MLSSAKRFNSDDMVGKYATAEWLENNAAIGTTVLIIYGHIDNSIDALSEGAIMYRHQDSGWVYCTEGVLEYHKIMDENGIIIRWGTHRNKPVELS